MPINDFSYTILEYINNAIRSSSVKAVNLGGVASSGGGAGIPPGGFVGYLPQTRVAYDMSELSASGLPESGWSLLDNLNHIRYDIDEAYETLSEDIDEIYTTLSGIGGGGHIIQNEGVTIEQQDTMNFVGNMVNVVNIGSVTTVTISGNYLEYNETTNDGDIFIGTRVNEVFTNNAALGITPTCTIVGGQPAASIITDGSDAVQTLVQDGSDIVIDLGSEKAIWKTVFVSEGGFGGWIGNIYGSNDNLIWTNLDSNNVGNFFSTTYHSPWIFGGIAAYRYFKYEKESYRDGSNWPVSEIEIYEYTYDTEFGVLPIGDTGQTLGISLFGALEWEDGFSVITEWENTFPQRNMLNIVSDTPETVWVYDDYNDIATGEIPVVDGTSSATTGGTPSTYLEWTHTVGVGEDRTLIVGVVLRNGVTVTDVEYDDTSLWIVRRNKPGSDVNAEIWVRPDVNYDPHIESGVHTIRVTVSESTLIVAGAISFSKSYFPIA